MSLSLLVPSIRPSWLELPRSFAINPAVPISLFAGVQRQRGSYFASSRFSIAPLVFRDAASIFSRRCFASGPLRVSRDRLAVVEDAVARIDEMNRRGMYENRGPWRRLLERINRDFPSLVAAGERSILCVVSAVSASTQATACPPLPAFAFAANVLQLLATAAPAAIGGGAATEIPALVCSHRTRLRLLLLLQPLFSAPQDTSTLRDLRRQVVLPVAPQCMQALQVGAAAANTSAMEAETAPSAAPESFAEIVRSRPFAVIELLLDTLHPSQHSQGRLEAPEGRGALENLASAARALLPLLEGEGEVEAAFICAKILSMQRRAAEADSNNNSKNNNNINNNAAEGSAGLALMSLRVLLRAPLHSSDAAQIELASAALYQMKEFLATMLGRMDMNKAPCVTETGAIPSLVSAVENHVRAAAAARAAHLEPKEVLQVIAAVSETLSL